MAIAAALVAVVKKGIGNEEKVEGGLLLRKNSFVLFLLKRRRGLGRGLWPQRIWVVLQWGGEKCKGVWVWGIKMPNILGADFL